MQNKNRRITKVCAGCGNTFAVKKSLKSQKYCSMECRKKSTKVIVTCAQCGKMFEDQRSRYSKYCSISCGITARNLTDQNPSYHRDISGENNPMFGKGGFRGETNGMYGKLREKSPAWKGGRKERKDGYVFVAVPVGHPYAIDGIYVLENRFVMEQHLGRYLLPSEVVHHIDENPNNNAIENLCLYASQSEHLRDAHSVGAFGLS